MKRLLTLIVTLCLCVSFSACHARVDLSVEPTLPDDIFDSLPNTDDGNEEPVGDMDEMAAYAWELYSAAVEAEDKIKTYDLTYEGTNVTNGDTAKTRARIVRVARDNGCEMLIQTNEQQGYFNNGIGYFSTEDKKYWLPIDEEGFMGEMGFTESPTLSEAAFGNALVTENEDGTRTVSCPLSGNQAASYVAQLLGVSAMGISVEYVEECVTVDADGAPISFTSRLKAAVAYAGTVSIESSSTYTAVGDVVTLTPPDDLDSYAQAE